MPRSIVAKVTSDGKPFVDIPNRTVRVHGLLRFGGTVLRWQSGTTRVCRVEMKRIERVDFSAIRHILAIT